MGDKVEKLVLVHLSDITKHDAHMVHYMTQDGIDILSKLHPNEKFEKIYLWSDGCAAQYKGKKTFFYLDEYSVPVERHYFGSEHGKNECDGITGQIAQRYNNSILSVVTVISNARDLKEFLCKEYENERTMIFKLIEKDDKDL